MFAVIIFSGIALAISVAAIAFHKVSNNALEAKTKSYGNRELTTRDSDTPSELVLIPGEIFPPRELHRTGLKRNGNTYVMMWGDESVKAKSISLDDPVISGLAFDVIETHKTMVGILKERNKYKALVGKDLVDTEVIALFNSKAEKKWEQMNFLVQQLLDDYESVKEEKEVREIAEKNEDEMNRIREAHNITADTLNKLLSEEI